MKKYKIELNEEQVHIIELACELVTRIGLQQYKQITDVINNLEFKNAGNQFTVSHEFGDMLLQQLKSIINKSDSPLVATNCYRGISNEDTPEQSKIACDIYQVLRYVRSWANAEHKPEERNEHFTKYMTVNYDKPMQFGKEPLIKCEELHE